VDLGPMPADTQSGAVLGGLRQLLERGELCDVVIVVNGRSFPAHRVALAAASPSLHQCLSSLESEGSSAADQAAFGVRASCTVLRLDGISHMEAVQAMVDRVYGTSRASEYCPATDGVNRDVLWLAERFQLAELREEAARWLVRGLSTENILGRIAVCEEFQLSDVRDYLLQQLVANPHALFVLAKDPDALKVPAVLQDALLRVLKLLGADAASALVPTPPSGSPVQQVEAPAVLPGRPHHQAKQAKKAGA